MEKIELISDSYYEYLCKIANSSLNKPLSKFKSIDDLNNFPFLNQLPFRKVDFVDISWDTSNINIESLIIADFCHEAAHYFISPKENKKLINYGLGSGFQDSLQSPVIVSDCDRQKQEDLSCILEWSFMKHLNCSDYEISIMIYNENMSCVCGDMTKEKYNEFCQDLKNMNNIFSEYNFQLV